LPNGPDNAGPPAYSKNMTGPCPAEEYIEIE
jgi:hypothetical protein